MDKILAFSIMSSSPAEISGAGYTTRLSWRSGGAKKHQQQQEEKVEQSSPPEKKPVARAPRFAPEFDGIDCFESIVPF
ncbi:uncharacterized protein LOC124668564 [Lolium rigidum]|uniref:uncharacterized protein LOC124668564 n=1 Tax=Lolium rigidum TaxID=89674 RepID=UPI001F5C219B|nr:uncharacterized protein LOC124668564 [Lolium rigidum]